MDCQIVPESTDRDQLNTYCKQTTRKTRPRVRVAKLSTNGMPNAIELVAGKDAEQVEFPFGVAVAKR